ncbi:hypothetical protein D1007_05921 [Hordeum vulgare]|nr:hypothetical protein D1007_05921 [Hordeum vulgare]
MSSGSNTHPAVAASVGPGLLLGTTLPTRPTCAPVRTMLVIPHHQGLRPGNHAGASQTSTQAPPQGTRREPPEARFLAALGDRCPAFPGALQGTRREYRRPDYINSWRRTLFDDDRVGTRPDFGGSSTGYHSSRRHTHDLTSSPRVDRYEQHRGGRPREWFRGDAQRGCPREAHLLAGSCFRQTSGSGDRGPLAWERVVDAPLHPGREALARGCRV